MNPLLRIIRVNGKYFVQERKVIKFLFWKFYRWEHIFYYSWGPEGPVSFDTLEDAEAEIKKEIDKGWENKVIKQVPI